MALLWIWGWFTLKKVDWEIDIPGVCKAGFSKEPHRRPSRVLVNASSIKKAACWKQIWRQLISGSKFCFFSLLLHALSYFHLLWWASFLLFSFFFSIWTSFKKKKIQGQQHSSEKCQCEISSPLKLLFLRQCTTLAHPVAFLCCSFSRPSVQADLSTVPWLFLGLGLWWQEMTKLVIYNASMLS